MTETDSRLRRRLAEKVGACCDDDVDRRLDELDALADEAFADEAFADDPTPAIFRILGDETRYRLARLLSVADEELCVCELDPFVDVSESAVSHALSDLAAAGLVDRRKEGNWRYYTSTPLADDLLATADRGVRG